MLRISRYLLASLILLLSVVSLNSAPIGVHIAQNYSGQIPSQTKVWDIATLDNGYTFLATQEAVVVFDGNRWSVHSMNNGYDVRSVLVDKDKMRVYVGGINEFGYLSPDARGVLYYTCLSDKLGEDKLLGNIWGIFSQHNSESIYLQGDYNLLKYNTHAETAELINSNGIKIDCSAMINGVLYLGTEDGLKFLMGNDIISVPYTSNLRNARIRSILPYKDGIMVVTAKSGVFYYDRQRLFPLPFGKEIYQSKQEVFCADIHNNTLALGTILDGVCIIDTEQGSIQYYNESNGLINNTVLSLKFNSEGDLWTGFDLGFSKLLLHLPVTTLDNKTLRVGSGYSILSVGNKLLLGTNRGLFEINDNLYSKNDYKFIEGTTGQVWMLRRIHDKVFCAHDRGLFMITANGNAIQISGIGGCYDIQPIAGEENLAYVGAYDGLYVIDTSAGNVHTIGIVDGFDGCPYNFVQMSPSVIWSVEGARGIVCTRVDYKKMTASLINVYTSTDDNVPLSNGVHISKIGNAIELATPVGLYRYNSEKNLFERDLSMEHHFNSQPPYYRLIQNRNKLWLYSANAVSLYDMDSDKPALEIPLMSVAARPLSGSDAIYPISDYTIVVPGIHGYSIYDFENYAYCISDIESKVRINSITLVEPNDSIVYSGNFATSPKSPVIDFKYNSLKIDFGNVEDTANGTVAYSYKLNNEEWSSFSSSTTKEYTNLPSGIYTFHIRAKFLNGDVVSDTINFEITTPWYLSVWMKILVVVLIIVIIVLIFVSEHKRVSHKEQKIIMEKNTEIAIRQADYDFQTKIKDDRIEKLEQENLRNELNHKSQEMMNALVSLAHKNEILTNLKSELQQISRKYAAVPDLKKSIIALQSSIDVSMMPDKVFKRVEEEFDLMHNDFTKRLRARYPDLSKNEILMCCYIFMDLSSKEIAPLLNISIRGVETMRYRIRKKFNLSREDNLSEFLLNNFN